VVLSETGRALATRVMRKHRLAECLLVSVIGLPWEEVHTEACRWEHVISEHVEQRLVELLGYPVHCPHGNVIPGLAELGVPPEATDQAELARREPVHTMLSVAAARPAPVVIERISEQVQSDIGLMLKLKRSGIQPGRKVTLTVADDGVRVTSGDGAGSITADLPRRVAAHVFVAVP
jgi:DtxR family Mn-dependent transcriptional regulator